MGLPRVAGFEFGQHGQVLANLVGQTEENAAAFLGGGGGPWAIFEGGFGGGDGAVHVVGIGVWNLRDDFFARGIVDGEGLGGLAVDPFAVDVHLISADVGFHSTGHKDLLRSSVGLKPAENKIRIRYGTANSRALPQPF